MSVKMERTAVSLRVEAENHGDGRQEQKQGRMEGGPNFLLHPTTMFV
jgi:hypothetical protein